MIQVGRRSQLQAQLAARSGVVVAPPAPPSTHQRAVPPTMMPNNARREMFRSFSWSWGREIVVFTTERQVLGCGYSARVAQLINPPGCHCRRQDPLPALHPSSSQL